MDRKERFDDLNVAITTALRGLQAGIYTALPGVLQSFDADKRVAEVQPVIQAQVLQPDGSTQTVTLPLLTHCPVVFPRGGGYELTFPLSEGDEGLVVFACRCVDAWWESGGVQPQAELRMHDLSDGFFIPGPFSQATKPEQAASTTEVQIRSLDGEKKISLGDTVQMSLDNGDKKIVVGDTIQMSINGTTTLVLDDAIGRVSVVAVNGLWVNGVRVTVP